MSELLGNCTFCNERLPRYQLTHHERNDCQLRPCSCRFAAIGCPWRGPSREVSAHHDACSHRNISGNDVMRYLEKQESRDGKSFVWADIFNILSHGETVFLDLKMVPNYTPENDNRLYYETVRFNAFDKRWNFIAKISNDDSSVGDGVKRTLSYQIVARDRLRQPITMHSLILINNRYVEGQVRSKVSTFTFTRDSKAASYSELQTSQNQLNALLSLAFISFRLVLSRDMI